MPLARPLAPTLPLRLVVYALGLLLALALSRVSASVTPAGIGSGTAVQDREPVNPAENR
jgi:hypothetical protein